MIKLQDITLQRGTHRLLDKANTIIQPHKRAAIIGANGCGKSSLFKLLLNELTLDSGTITIPGQWRIAHMAQEVTDSVRTALDFVLDGDQVLRDTEQLIAKANQQEDHTALAQAYHQLETIDGYTATSRAEKLLHGLGFKQHDMDKPVKDFSGGWRIRLNLAQALMCPSDLLLLDEPTNHLDIDATLWLEQWLNTYPGTLLFISHDRDFIDSIAEQILHIEHHIITSYSGHYSSFEEQRTQRLAQQQANFEKQQQRINEITHFVNRFKAKATKAKQAQSRIKELERMEKIAPAHIDSPFHFRFIEADKTSDPLLSLEKASIGYGDTAILDNVELILRSDARIGLLGPNGAGKSTLVKLLATETNTGATLQQGQRLESDHIKMGYFAQHQLEALDLSASALLHIQRLSPNTSEQVIRNFLGSFNFHGNKALDPIAPFSGGEKARLALAIIVWQKPNLLILDEPTNHLDLEMRHALTLALQMYKGALLIISHDRHLLKNTVDQFYLVADGTIQLFDGDLIEYQQWLKTSLQEQEQKEETTNSHRSDKIDKKQQRRQDAAKRAQCKPLTNKLKKIEKEMDLLQSKLTSIGERLVDDTLYTKDNQSELQVLLQQQGEIRHRVDELEEDWLTIHQEIEDQQ